MTRAVQSPPESLRQEQELIRRMLAGDERAFETFSDDYFPALYRFALSRLSGDTELAREVVQATVCKVFPKLKTFRGEASLFTWLCSCCRNEIALHFRSRGRAPLLVELEERTAGERTPDHRALLPDSPERALLRGETARLVHEALDHLPPKYSKALEWKYLEGLSVKEIARRLEVGAKAAESLLTRARLAFRSTHEGLSREPGLHKLANTPPTAKRVST